MEANLLIQQLGPSSIVVEVPDDDQDVGVSGLPDRLSVVQGLDDSDQPWVLLDVPGQAVEVTGPGMAAQLAPGLVGSSCGFNSWKIL